MIPVDQAPAAGWRERLVRFRVAQLLGLAFLIGPIADLVRASPAPVRAAAIAVVVAAFAVLYVALLPPVRTIARHGRHAAPAALAVLAALAGLVLALGAPRSFSLLFVYVAAAAGMALGTAAAVTVAGVAAVAVGLGLALAGSDASTVFAYAITIVSIGVIMAALGATTRANRELRAARGELARLAVVEERVRIARDLHDLLGHTLSLIALKSELAAKLLANDPERANAELTDVQRVSREALGDVRKAVRGYRSLAIVDALESARASLAAAGIDCRVDTTAAPLPSDVESVLALAVREAATNVVRHSGARACTITLSSDADDVALQVADDGAATVNGGDGTGLAGLAERARRLHGTFEAGARPGGGFQVRLTLPLAPT